MHAIVKHEMFSAASEIANVSQKTLVAACELYQLLNAAVRRRVLNVPDRTIPQNRPGGVSYNISDASVGVLFSGGLDSVVLAALCHNHVLLHDI
jgi:asparagine synthetase B (glutamine-hydrolysing)